MFCNFSLFILLWSPNYVWIVFVDEYKCSILLYQTVYGYYLLMNLNVVIDETLVERDILKWHVYPDMNKQMGLYLRLGNLIIINNFYCIHNPCSFAMLYQGYLEVYWTFF